MKSFTIFTAAITAFAASVAAMPAYSATDLNLSARDVCGPGYGSDQRRTNSPCEASNGDRHFCGCDRTGVVECRNGFWIEVVSCVGDQPTCHGGDQGGATC